VKFAAPLGIAAQLFDVESSDCGEPLMTTLAPVLVAVFGLVYVPERPTRSVDPLACAPFEVIVVHSTPPAALIVQLTEDRVPVVLLPSPAAVAVEPLASAFRLAFEQLTPY